MESLIALLSGLIPSQYAGIVGVVASCLFVISEWLGSTDKVKANGVLSAVFGMLKSIFSAFKK